MSLLNLQTRLLALHPGYFQPADYLESWITPDIAAFLMQHGSLMTPRRVKFGMGRHLDCCRSCLEYAALNPKATPFFGMALSRSFTKPEDMVWWIHNWNMLPDGTLIDSEPAAPLPVPALYFGVKWGAELWQLILHRSDTELQGQYLGQIDDINGEISAALTSDLQLSERAHFAYQALSRGTCRTVSGGEALPMKGYIVEVDPQIEVALSSVMPGARWKTWTPYFVKESDSLIDTWVGRVLKYLSELPEQVDRISSRSSRLRFMLRR